MYEYIYIYLHVGIHIHVQSFIYVNHNFLSNRDIMEIKFDIYESIF